MKKFVNPNIAPIGGYVFCDPDTGKHFSYPSYAELESAVQKYREDKDLPRIAKFRAVWEHYICENVAGMEGRCCQVAEYIKRSFEQFWQGGKSFVRAAVAGKAAFVDQTTADRRAAICKQCDQNVKNIGHRNFYTDTAIKQQVGQRRSVHHDDLHTCKICSCILKAKVFYNNKIVAGSITDTELVQLTRRPRDAAGRPLRCWQLDCMLDDMEEEDDAKEEKG